MKTLPEPSQTDLDYLIRIFPNPGPVEVSGVKKETSAMYTQKALGINFLVNHVHTRQIGTAETLVQLRNKIFFFPTDFDRIAKIKLPAFARPCPLTPRHGFVESRMVHSIRELISTYVKAKQEEASAEMVVMPPLRGRVSAVVNNAGITFGLGNAGATSGGRAVFIPAAPIGANAWTKDYICNRRFYDCAIQDTAYVELVEHNNKMYMVQVRDGPAAPSTQDFIPRETKVTFVLYATPDTDLLEWEKLVEKEYKKHKEGLVINFYKGSLSTHQAVHGIQRGIPVVTSTRITKGETLSPIEEQVGDFFLTGSDFKSIAEWMQYWTNRPELLYLQGNQCRNAILSSIAIFHSSQTWDGRNELKMLRALSPVMLARFLTAACVAEVRHFQGALDEMVTDLNNFKPPVSGSLSREGYYDRVLPAPWDDLAGYAKSTMIDFEHRSWTRRSFGGEPWRQIAKGTLALIKACNKFLIEPNREHWITVSDSLNTAVSLVHHGGASALAKWVSQGTINEVAECPVMGLANTFIAGLVLPNQFRSAADEEEKDLEDFDEDEVNNERDE